MPEQVGGIIDNVTDNQILRLTTPERLAALIEEIAATVGNSAATLAEHLSAAIAALVSGKPAMHATAEDAGPRPLARRIVRHKAVIHLMREKGLDRAAAKAKVAALTDDQIDTAIRTAGPLPVEGTVSDWFKKVWDFITSHWLQILLALLPLLLL